MIIRMTTKLVVLITVKLPEEPVKRHSPVPKTDKPSDNNMSKRRRLSYAETLKCTENANSEIPVHTLTEDISSRRKLISPATS